MITIASDVGLKKSNYSVRDDTGRIISKQKIMNEPNSIINYIRQFPGPKRFAMEAGYNWPLFYDLLNNKEVDKFMLLHPQKLKAIIDSQAKCDGKDADILSYLTHVGYVPESYKATPDTQIFRRILRARVSMSLHIASIKNRIHALVNSYVFYCQRPKNFKDLFCKRGIEYLKSLDITQDAKMLLEHLLDEMHAIKDTQASLDKRITEIPFKPDEMRVISAQPGMRGKVCKYIIMAEIDDVMRFRNARSLMAYSGLVPRDHSSGDKIRKGKLRTQSNQFLKWAVLEAVYPAILADKELKEYYKHIKQISNASSAKIATARKLLAKIYHALKEQRTGNKNRQ